MFVVAIVVPCALLVALTLRMLVQERELDDKRVADERQRIADDVRQALVARVERLRFDASRDGASPGRHPEIALVAQVDGGRLMLPWEQDGAAAAAIALEAPRFREAVRRGERHEFIEARFADAAGAYRDALREAATPAQTASAGLLVARALTKAKRETEAASVFETVLDHGVTVLDDQGIPYAFYAARRLLDLTPTDESIRRTIAGVLDAVPASVLRPAAVYMARDIATDLGAAAPALVRATADLEQALELQKAFPGTLLATRSGDDDATARWMSFGSADNRWLLNAPENGNSGRIVAVRTEPVLRAVVAGLPVLAGAGPVTLSTAADGESLAPEFPGLSVRLPGEGPEGARRRNPLRQPVYLATLAVVLGGAFFGSYLFWRDVRREIRLAEMRSQFVSSVSHELKTPLTAIRLFAETLLLGRSPRPEVSQEYLETIVNESERLTRLLNNVLDFSKIEQGTKTYRLAPQSPAALVITAVNALRYPLAQQGFELRVRVADNVPSISADADAIQQALLNLLSNAMKYSGAGRVIDLELLQENGQAVIAVSDRGIGIPPGEQKRIFDKFYRVPGIENQRIAGTGLGLTLVDHVARAHGGRVTVTSTPGAGSTFALVLPLTGSPQPDCAEASVVA